MDILQGLNEAQKASVISEAKVLQVLAPPGSGKTKTLTTRVAYLIAHRQLQPWNIIVCTFTVKAAREMKERIRGFIGDGLEKKLILGTFHSVALRYLRAYGNHIGLEKDFGIADTSDSRAILRRIIRQHRLDETKVPDALARISAQKVKGITSEQFALKAKNTHQKEFSQLYAEYQATLAASKLLDYDDILLRCSFLLKAHPRCVSNIEAVLIDEFQDTNNIQYDLMGLFAQQLQSITIVGDPDQSIYGFRSAEIANLGRMRQHWPDTITINLEENYRSSGGILHAAQKIIEQDESRPPKKLQATHSHGLRPVLRKLPTANAEADWLVAEIKRAQLLTGNMLKANDFAILLRSAALSRPIEAAMGKAGIPYRMVGGLKFYDRIEVKLVIDYLRVVNNPHHNEAVERVVNTPPRKIGEVTLKSLQEEARAKGMSLWDLIRDAAQGHHRVQTKISAQAQKGLNLFMNVILTAQRKLNGSEEIQLFDLINIVLQKIGLQDFLKQKYSEDYDIRWANVEELIAQATDASQLENLASSIDEEALPDIEGLEQQSTGHNDVLSVYLNNIALNSAAEHKADENGQVVQQVVISTIHAAKGLEWPVVFIPACYDGSIPHSRADDHDEERRLLYVGMTRAQALLYLSCPTRNTQKGEMMISAFLTQPGTSAFFEEHGPSFPDAVVRSFALTLGRQCPSVEEVAEASIALERHEDNDWPLDGEELPEQRAKWDYGLNLTNHESTCTNTTQNTGFTAASTITHPQDGSSVATTSRRPGFVSAASRFSEELAKREADARLRKVDHRIATKDHRETGITGRKRQIEGQGSIASFFGKRQKSEKLSIQPKQDAETMSANAPAVLKEISNAVNIQHSIPSSLKPSDAGIQRLPRSAPLHRPQASRYSSKTSGSSSTYVFLSSSPPRADSNETTVRHENDCAANAANDHGDTASTYLPASTMHTTSMQMISSQRRTLGVRRSMNGWAARGGRRA